jgi:hypothetical protein
VIGRVWTGRAQARLVVFLGTEAAREACRAYHSSFPSLREVRNSVQHIEDRGRGLGRGEKPLDLKPVANRMVNAPEGALILQGLNGTKYGATMADGHYGARLRSANRRLRAFVTTSSWYSGFCLGSVLSIIFREEGRGVTRSVGRPVNA